MWKNHRLNKRLSPSLLGRISGRRCFFGRFRGLLFLLLLVLETRHCDGLCSSKKSQSTRPCCPIRTDELRSCSNNANRNRHWRTASRAATADLAAGRGRANSTPQTTAINDKSRFYSFREQANRLSVFFHYPRSVVASGRRPLL